MTKLWTISKKGLEVCSKSSNPDQSLVALLLNHVGSAFCSLSEFERSKTFHQEALKIDLSLYGEWHPQIARDYNNLGMAYLYMGEAELGLSYLENALNIRLDILGAQHPDTRLSYENLSYGYDNLSYEYFKSEDYDKALLYLDRLLNVKLEFLGSDHQDLALTYSNIAYDYLCLGDASNSLDYFKESYRIYSIHPEFDIEKAKETIGYIYNLSHFLGRTEELEKIIPTIEIIPDGEASMRGYSGEYNLYEFGPWTIDGNDNLLETNLAMQDQPVSMTFYRDGKVFKEDFGSCAKVRG
ncbi:MAG: tetratricopeptide repeat protein [Bacteroidales bacterium]|nr:tetratricopeptide repeat protein [Bacteroidales bacterium]